MTSRKIIHIDMDCFYAAVEMRDNVDLRGKPVGVGGYSDRGVLTTASYEARKYGVRSAMSTQQARKLCPDLIIVPVNFSKYRSESQKIRQIFARYTEKIQPLSLDEAYLDVSECQLYDGSASLIAKALRKDIFTETGLTASAGIAPNKFLAKVASDWKKPNGQFTVAPKDVPQFVRTLPIRKVPGIGKVTAAKMRDLKIQTCGDLQEWSIADLTNKFGKWGSSLFDLSRGIDNREVKAGGQRKSLSVEQTNFKDLKTLPEILSKTPKLFAEFQIRMENMREKLEVESLVVKIKFYDFTQTTLSRTNFQKIDLANFNGMIEQAWLRKSLPVRLIGLGVKFKTKSRKEKLLQLRLL